MKKWMQSMLVAAALGASTAQGAEEAAFPEWVSRLSLNGDLRNRFETIEEDDKNTRNRFRIRARIGLDAEVNETVDAHFRLAGGEADPVSSNQTLGDGFSKKDVWIDRAYADWHPAALEGLNLWGGKLAIPFETVKDLIWDDDLNPEGVAARYALGGEDLTLLVNLAALVAEERSSTSEDAYLYGAQAALTLAPEAFSLLGGVGFFYFDNLQGFPTLFDSTDGFGNRVVEVTDPATGEVTETLYAEEFSELEFFARLCLDAGMPLTLYADSVINVDADSREDTGYMFGATAGKAREPGSVEFDYNWRRLEADAAVGLFVDSDSFGGGTDGEGHKFQAKVQLSKNWQAVGTFFISDIGISGEEKDYRRGQLDLVAKF